MEMLMKLTLLVATFFYSLTGTANILVVEGKPYEVKPMELNTCGEEGDAAHKASIFVIGATKGAGELAADAGCKAGKTELCSAEGKSKFWVGLLFTQIRKYPSRYRSSGCASVRNYCVSLCESSKVFSKDDCQIECNQYEIYNK